MKKIVLLISISICVLLNAEIVTRQSIISQAEVYAEYSWKVNKPNPRYELYKTKGTQITGVAYSYGDKDNTATFQSDINAGVMPRNWEDNYNSGHTTGYTGIDCSGLVSDCWNVGIQTGAALVGLCMRLANSSLLKMGDAVRDDINPHIQLYAWNNNVYEAVGWTNPTDKEHQMVRLSPADYENKTFYSIFPQFSSAQPGNGHIVHLEDPNVTEYDIDIELTIRASGSVDNDEFVLKIDDEEVDKADYELVPIITVTVDYNEYRLECSYTFVERGFHKIEVKAGNDKSNNIYVDEYEWNFLIGEGYGVFLIEPDYLYIPMGSNADQKVELLYFPPDYCSPNPSGDPYELNYSILGNFVSGWVTPNWSDYQGVIESTGQIRRTWQYNIKNESDKEGSKNKIISKAYNNDDYLEVQAIVTSENPDHAGNHPDDAQLIAESNYPTDRIYNPWSNIGVLLSGAGIGISHIMGKFNTGICGVIPENFKISGISGRQLEDLDVLIIGSAGIYILNNPILRERLIKWVENGGTVISMTSQFGFEWEYLPIPDGEQLQGYGWDEDQYCSNSSVYIEDRHPIISGQTNKIPSMYVDGYIDKYPSNAKIPLKRTASTMPAAIEYQYGEGNVIITSDYVDWGYNHNQYFDDDLVFVRDMIKYGEIAGKYIEEITDYAVNQTNVDIEIKNNTSRTADKCVIKIFSPDNILLDSIMIDSMNLIGDGSYTYSTVINCEQRGIYAIKYTLLNVDNTKIVSSTLVSGFCWKGGRRV